MPPEKNAKQPASAELKPLRTYQSDVEELMAHEHVSKADIALAESARERTRAEMSRPPSAPKVLDFKVVFPKEASVQSAPRRFPLRIAAAALALLAVFGLAFLALRWSRAEDGKETRVPKKGAASAYELSLDGRETRAAFVTKLRARLAAHDVPLNETRALALLREGEPLKTSELFGLLETKAPPALVRALGAHPTLGVHGIRGNQLFLLFGVVSFDHAFEGMLQFEETLLDELGPLFGVFARSPARISSAIRSGEPARISSEIRSSKRGASAFTTTTELILSALRFKDVIIKNKDARAVFRDGKIIFLYSFPDKETLIMTTNEETFKTLLGKSGGGKLRSLNNL
ncbi:MAG: hypothetical protein AAB699_01645 [Patescibacteria group bacterium]